MSRSRKPDGKSKEQLHAEKQPSSPAIHDSQRKSARLTGKEQPVSSPLKRTKSHSRILSATKQPVAETPSIIRSKELHFDEAEGMPPSPYKGQPAPSSFAKLASQLHVPQEQVPPEAGSSADVPMSPPVKHSKVQIDLKQADVIKVRKQQSDDEGRTLVLGDLHANYLTLIQVLRKLGVIELDPKDYQRLYKLFHQPTPYDMMAEYIDNADFSEEASEKLLENIRKAYEKDRKEIEAIFDKITVINEKLEIILAGDDMGDRAKRPDDELLFLVKTLNKKIGEKRVESGLDMPGQETRKIKVAISNHTVESVFAIMDGFPKNEGSLKTLVLYENYIASLLSMFYYAMACGEEKTQEIKELFVDHYLPGLGVAHVLRDKKKDALTQIIHACNYPHSKMKTLFLVRMLKKMSIHFNEEDKKSLEESSELLNLVYQKLILDDDTRAWLRSEYKNPSSLYYQGVWDRMEGIKKTATPLKGVWQLNGHDGIAALLNDLHVKAGRYATLDHQVSKFDDEEGSYEPECGEVPYAFVSHNRTPVKSSQEVIEKRTQLEKQAQKIFDKIKSEVISGKKADPQSEDKEKKPDLAMLSPQKKSSRRKSEPSSFFKSAEPSADTGAITGQKKKRRKGDISPAMPEELKPEQSASQGDSTIDSPPGLGQ